MTGFVALISLVGLTACASPDGLEAIHDPYEYMNRRTHELNKSLDKAILKPASDIYASAMPGPLGIGVSNFSNFLDLPASVVNNVLQLNFDDAVSNTALLVINGTVGVAGLYDAASEAGIYPAPADFGQTLNRWGVGEGAFLELPILGASTERDAAGILVDALLNPLTILLPNEWKLVGTGAETLAMLGDRARFATTVESVLYESADSYSQSRLFYLQSRRHELGMRPDEEDYFDPYEDPYE